MCLKFYLFLNTFLFKQGCHALRETKGSFDFFSENFREVVRLKKKFQRIFFDLE